MKIDEREITDVLNDLAYSRLVRRVVVEGEPFYELTHEYLIDEIDKWLSEEERELRNVRKLLEYEMDISKMHDSPMPLVRAELIQKYINKLGLKDDEICLIEEGIKVGYKELEDKRRLEGQLQQAQKMEAIGTLAGGIAHDFNNILSGIFGYAELLDLDLNELGLDKARDKLKVILDSSKRAAELTRQILQFARGRQENIEKIRINDVLENTLEFIKKTIGPQYEIEFSPMEGIWIIEADMSQLEQAIINIFTNARDAMADGGVISCYTRNIEPNEIDVIDYSDLKHKQYVEIAISDTGSGIPEEIKDRIFEPFFTTKEPGKGTGLGLASVYGIVKRHGGEIHIESYFKKGTIVKIFMPSTGVSTVEEIEDVEIEQQIADKIDRVLLVDDEALITTIGKEMLEKIGFKVITANDGLEAIEKFSENRDKVDVIIMDLEMPKLSGIQAGKKFTN